jgi:2,4-didehydro-3-deoxy-L-rhamnonate hydrolase
MKLVRFGKTENEKPGILNEQNERLDLSNYFEDWNSDFFATNGLEKLRSIISSVHSLPKVPMKERWSSCVARPYKIICIGLNYYDHACESGMKIPEEPIIFMKATNTITGPYDNIYIPKNSTKTDWEVELGIIVGKEATYLNSINEANDFIAGFCISHDVSERAFQLERGGQWTKGKSCKSFNPLGPYMATTDEIQSVGQLEMELKVNNVIMQHGNTNKMIFNIYYIIWYLSQFMVLEPGDVISTGTPPGVGMGKNPPIYLSPGDIVELKIEGLGIQKQIVIKS